MEKSKYIQPEISICHVETDQMMMVGSPIPPLPVSMILLTGTLRC